jgi:hypothetical protein
MFATSAAELHWFKVKYALNALLALEKMFILKKRDASKKDFQQVLKILNLV